MKALILREHGPLENLKIEETAAPVPGADEALIDVHAASVNFPDLLVINGTYQNLPQRPFSPGKDLAGVVSAVGGKVTTCRPGDRVMAQIEYGAFAEQCAVPQNNCFVMPDAMSYAEGAAMGLVFPTAYFALMERGMYRSGETVLVNGAAGGVGFAAVQVAKALGATVLACVSTPAQAEFVKRHGADHVIMSNVPDLRESFRKQVYDAVGARGVDLVLDPVGGDVFDASLRALAWCGRVVIIGFAEGRIPEVKTGYLLVKNISLIGMQVSDYRDREPEKWRRAQAELFRLYESGRIRPHIMASFPLSDYLRAFAMVRDRDVLGKVVLSIKE